MLFMDYLRELLLKDELSDNWQDVFFNLSRKNRPTSQQAFQRVSPREREKIMYACEGDRPDSLESALVACLRMV